MDKIDMLFKEYNVTKIEQKQIMDVFDKYRNQIASGEKVNYAMYESDIINIFGGDMMAMRHTPPIEYHFCEYVAKEFAEDMRWEEVFQALYGDFPKYGGKIER